MKKLIYMLILILFIFNIEPHSSVSDEKQVEITEEQAHMAKWLGSYSSHIETKWINSYTIQVTYHPSYIEVTTKSEMEGEAGSIAIIGYEVTKKETCVKITDVKGKELAYKCHGSKAL